MTTNPRPTYALLPNHDMWGKVRKGRFDVFEQRGDIDILVCANIGVKGMAEQLMKRGVPTGDAIALERKARDASSSC